jgi:cytoskeleton protein RodZ
MTDSEDIPTSATTAGQLLRQAREQRKLSVAEVALQLNLRVTLIAQIEADQLDSSMLITFVRGYLRAYARLVKLPEQQVLQAYEQQTGSPAEPTKPMRTFSNRTARQATENRFMWLTYAIGLILLLMLVLWWWQRASPVTENQPVIPAAMLPVVANEQSDVTNSAELLITAVEPEFEAEPATITAISLPDFIAEQSIAELVIASEPQPDEITMVFQDNCWIDVLDADGNRIAYGTKDAGYKMSVSGKAPFIVTLGNPSVVLVTLNNKPFDMSSLPAGRVAKFTLAKFTLAEPD